MEEPTLGALVLKVLSMCGVTATLIISAVYLLLKMKYTFWVKRGIPGPKPDIFFGSFKEAVFLKCTESEALNAHSKRFMHEKYIGIYLFWKPILLVKDLELVKKIMEIDFHHFTDHPVGAGGRDAALFSLFGMHGSEWKSRRAHFSKLFTPGRLKEYSVEMQHGLISLLDDLDSLEKESADVDVLNVIEPYVLNSLTSVLFGMDLLQSKEKSELVADLVTSFVTPSVPSVIKFLCYGLYPKFFRYIGLRTLDTKLWDVSRKFSEELLRSRINSGLAKNDFLSMLMNLMVEGAPNIKKITFEESCGHIFSFLQAGSLSTKVLSSHALLYLARNREMQEKLRTEINEVMNGSTEITYEKIQSMTYLDNIISECHRVLPVLGILKRTCTKEYKVDEKLTIPEGMDVYIDINHIHMDPEIFPEPEKFMPERWSNGQADPSALTSFGRGPRICLGKRFADVEMKLLLTSIVARYMILPSEKMKKDIMFDPRKLFISIMPTDKLWIKLRRLDQSSFD